MSLVFLHQGDTIRAELGPIIIQDTLAPGFYEAKVFPEPPRPYVYLVSHTPFELPSKIYGDVETFTDRCLRTFTSFNKNQGVLLTGKPGTGKTVQAKHLAHQCVANGIPVIQVSTPISGSLLDGFLVRVNQPVCVVIDEFEKVYHETEYLHSLLSIMDGLGSSTAAVLWLMTSNKEHPSEFLEGRAGRVRYQKKFELMSDELIADIIQDRLKHCATPLVKETIEAVKFLEGITVDGLTALTDEVALHKESPHEFMEILNVVPAPAKYDTELSATLVSFNLEKLKEREDEIHKALRAVGLPEADNMDEGLWSLTPAQKVTLLGFGADLVTLTKVKALAYNVQIKPDPRGHLNYHIGFQYSTHSGGYDTWSAWVRGPASEVVERHPDGSVTVTDYLGRKWPLKKQSWVSPKKWTKGHEVE